MPLDETLHGRYIYDVMHVLVLQYIRTGARTGHDMHYWETVHGLMVFGVFFFLKLYAYCKGYSNSN